MTNFERLIAALDKEYADRKAIEICAEKILKVSETPVNQDRPPNFRNKDGKLYLVRCFACEPEYGTENWAMAVATGSCAWCGWEESRHE